ncbi:MAG: DUF3656 domain-containing U32 family peptidase [Schwartzia sp. (in: firmicutes)]
MVELLAPAGSREAFVAAIENGANAVYLAGQHFGARAYAANFDEAALREAIRFAHLREVAVHVTVNTIVADEELGALAEYLRFLYEAGADAILVQDLGAARLARQVVPDLPRHASTQMTVHNLAGVQALERLGFSRVVLARELSLAEIRHICRHSRAEIEVFAHGALCVSYSGQCLMSSLIGGRSGNRGRCAQPCRLPYTLVDANGRDVLGQAAGQFLLSPRDLNTVDLLPDLIEAGVDSLKIEGRMKRPEYVAVVTKVYRRSVDAALKKEASRASGEEDHRALVQIFNRDFTTAYLTNSPGRAMMSDRKPNNRGLLVGRVISYDKEKQRVTVKLVEEIHRGDEIDFWVKVGGRATVSVTEIEDEKGRPMALGRKGETVRLPLKQPVGAHDRLFRVYDAALMETARQTFQAGAPVRRFPIRVHLHAAVGAPVSVRMTTATGNSVTALSDFVAVAAEHRALTYETAYKQMARLGATVYALAEFTADIAPDVMVPVSVLNDLRRRGTELLDAVRLKRYARPPLASLTLTKESAAQRLRGAQAKLMVSVDSVETARKVLDAGADGILFGGDVWHHALLSADDYRLAWEMARKKGKIIRFNTPRVLRDAWLPWFKSLLEAFRDFPPEGLNVHNLGVLALARDYTDIPLQSDFSLIVYNRMAAAELKSLGVERVTLSPELNFRQIEVLAKECPLPLEAIVDGYLELMLSAYCATGSFLGGVGEGTCSVPCREQRYFLRDRKDALFPLVTDGFCQMHVLNSQPLSMLPHLKRLTALGIDRVRIEGRYEEGRSLGSVVERYSAFLRSGRLTEEEEKQYQTVERMSFTRGHYFRGVL